MQLLFDLSLASLLSSASFFFLFHFISFPFLPKLPFSSSLFLKASYDFRYLSKDEQMSLLHFLEVLYLAFHLKIWKEW